MAATILPYSKEQTQAMFYDYERYVDMQTLWRKHNVSDQTFKYLRKKHKVPKRPDIPEQLLEMAVNDHVSGMLLKDVTAKYRISSASIYRYMKKYSIEYKNGHGRKYNFDKEFFKCIDNERKAYWLGFLYADGCVNYSEKTCKVPNRLIINISHKDRELLEKFLIDIDADYPIVDYFPSESTYGTDMMSKVYVNSTEFCSYLIEHGCGMDKTHHCRFPFASMDPSLYRHFIRGLFDGDGSVWGQERKQGYCACFSIVGHVDLLLDVQNILMQECDLNKTKLDPYHHKGEDLFDMRYGGRSQVQRIFEYLYQDSNTALQRKQEKFLIVSR